MDICFFVYYSSSHSAEMDLEHYKACFSHLIFLSCLQDHYGWPETEAFNIPPFETISACLSSCWKNIIIFHLAHFPIAALPSPKIDSRIFPSAAACRLHLFGKCGILTRNGCVFARGAAFCAALAILRGLCGAASRPQKAACRRCAQLCHRAALRSFFAKPQSR